MGAKPRLYPFLDIVYKLKQPFLNGKIPANAIFPVP